MRLKSAQRTFKSKGEKKMYDSRGRAQVVDADGRLYTFSTNVEKGDYFHKHYQQLANQGRPIIFRGGARDTLGRPLSGNLRVFVVDDAMAEIRQALDLATRGELEKARWWADQGQPEFTLEFLAKSDADEATKRVVLAEAYKRSGRRKNRLARWARRDGYVNSAKFDRRGASRNYRYAQRLLSGKAPLALCL